MEKTVTINLSREQKISILCTLGVQYDTITLSISPDLLPNEEGFDNVMMALGKTYEIS